MSYYKFEYEYPKVTQIKRLITKEEFVEYTKLSFELDAAEVILKKQKKNPAAIEKVRELKIQLKPFKFPFFVIGSPLYLAIETGILSLPKTQGGDHMVKITILENEELVKCVDESEE